MPPFNLKPRPENINGSQAKVDAHARATDPHTQYRLESADHNHQSTGLQAGQLDHGLAMTAASLLDDDHPQYVLESLFDANTIIKADSDNTPVALTVAEQTLVGRITGGNIAALTIAQIWGILRSFGGCYNHENGTAISIEAVNVPHACYGFTQGNLTSDWTYFAGGSKAITAYADNGDGKTQVTSAGHGLANGDIVTIAGTTNYDGVYKIEQKQTDTFVIAIAFVADDGASTGHAAAYLTGTISGYYKVHYTCSVSPSNSNDTIEFEIYLDTTEQVNTESRQKLANAGDTQDCSGHGILDYTAGEKVWLKVENFSGANDITIRNGNITVARAG